MKRWFYTDPLSAAYMAKHFGMAFSPKLDTGEVAWDVRYPQRGVYSAEWEPLSPAWDRYYVHPDSEHILRPQHADVVGNVAIHRCFGLYLGGTGSINVEVPMRHNGKSHFAMPQADCRIVERAGRPFLWPESEDARGAE